MADEESISERQLAEDLASELFSGAPRSVSEAVAEVDEEPPITVTDEPVQPEVDTEEDAEPPLIAADQDVEPSDEDTEEVIDEDENIVWAKKRYGDDVAKWARGAREQDQHISRLMNEKKEAEQLAVHWYETAQAAEQQAASASQMGMPLSAQEEAWIESVAMQNPMLAARQAAHAGNIPLYNAVLERVAEDNAGFAANIGAQVQLEMQQMAAQEEEQYAPRPLNEELSGSMARLGIDIAKDGPAMSDKIGELGEYHPYVQAILNGDQAERDLALRAVSDLVKTGTLSKQRVRNESKEDAIRREGELRRAAAGVVTGAPHTPPPEEDPLMAAMEAEWRARRQWGEE